MGKQTNKKRLPRCAKPPSKQPHVRSTALRRHKSGGARVVPRGTAQRTAQRIKRRQHRIVFFYIFTFLFVITGAVALSVTVLFKIDTIKVEGSSRYTEQEVIKIAGIVKGENLFLAKTKEASASIKKKLPYIETAVLCRRLPAQIIIQVKEGVPCGAVESNGKYAILDANEKVMEFADTVPKKCPVIRGVPLSGVKLGETISYKDEKTRTMFQTLQKALEKNGMDTITEIDISNAYDLKIVYDGRITMQLGLPTALDYKLRYAKSILKKDADIREKVKGTLNLSNAENNKVPFEPNYA